MNSSPEWWDALSTHTKAWVTILTATTMVVGIGVGWGMSATQYTVLPSRVNLLEASDSVARGQIDSAFTLQGELERQVVVNSLELREMHQTLDSLVVKVDRMVSVFELYLCRTEDRISEGECLLRQLSGRASSASDRP